MKTQTAPTFLTDLLTARSPSGFETEAQAVFDRHVKPAADDYAKDTMGNRIATLNPKGDPVLMFCGHMDELGLIIKHVDKSGFLYFSTIGGHDASIISGRRVLIQTAQGPVIGVTGKRAKHLMDESDQKKVPEVHQIWIDIGAKDKKEALERVSLGDVATYDHDFQFVHGSIGVARAFDDKAGAYVVGEALRRLAKERKTLAARVVSVASVQEEVGLRGATAAAYSVGADFAVAVDVGHATDHPDCDNRKFGEFKLGGGPIITKGANINPGVHARLVAAAKRLKIPYQIQATAAGTSTDTHAIQVSRGGVATGLVSIPLRYMHTPSEIVDLEDIERAVQLLVAFALDLKKGDNGRW